MRPQERHGRISRTTEMEMLQRRIGTIPHLLGNQANALCEFLNCLQEWFGVMSGGDFVMTALAGQQRPWSPLSPTGVGCTVFPLPEAVMVVAAPAGSIRRVHFEHCIDHAERILNDRIVRTTNTVANQFEKTGIDNLFRR